MGGSNDAKLTVIAAASNTTPGSKDRAYMTATAGVSDWMSYVDVPG